MKKKLPKNSTNLRHQISTILIWSPNGIILIVVSRDGGNPLLALSFNARSKLEEYLLSMRLMMLWISAYDSMYYGHHLPLY